MSGVHEPANGFHIAFFHVFTRLFHPDHLACDIMQALVHHRREFILFRLQLPDSNIPQGGHAEKFFTYFKPLLALVAAGIVLR